MLVVFFLPVAGKVFTRFPVGVSLEKRWLLACDFPFFLVLQKHTNSSTSLPGNILTLASAVFARHCQLSTESPKNKNFCYCGKKLPKQDRDACIRHNFSNPEFFRNMKKDSSVNRCWWQKFPKHLRDTSILSGWPQYFCWKLLSGQVERCFQKFAQNVFPEKLIFFRSIDKKVWQFFLIENPVSYEKSSGHVNGTFDNPSKMFRQNNG